MTSARLTVYVLNTGTAVREHIPVQHRCTGRHNQPR